MQDGKMSILDASTMHIYINSPEPSFCSKMNWSLICILICHVLFRSPKPTNKNNDKMGINEVKQDDWIPIMNKCVVQQIMLMID